jgi:hypothetical protein
MECNLSSMALSGCENMLVQRLRMSARVLVFVLGSMLPISGEGQEQRNERRVQCRKSRVEQGPREPKGGLRREETLCFLVVSQGSVLRCGWD